MKQNIKSFAKSVDDAIKASGIERYVYLDSNQDRFMSCPSRSKLFSRFEADHVLVGVYSTQSTASQIADDMDFALMQRRAIERNGRIASGARA